MSGRPGAAPVRLGLFAVVTVLAAAAVPACNRDPVKAGEKCTRSSECDEGLVCIEGACSHDLSALPNQGTVPMLMMEQEAPMEMPDAGAGMNVDMNMGMGTGGAGDAAASDAGVVPPSDAGP